MSQNTNVNTNANPNTNTKLAHQGNGQSASKQVSKTEAGGNGSRQVQALLPAVDVIEDAGGITMLADLPGVPRDKLTVQVESDNLTIEGEVALQTPEHMESSHVEVRLPRYRRSFTLSKELDGEQVSAEFNHGLLRLRIPKAKHAQPRKIEVKAAAV